MTKSRFLDRMFRILNMQMSGDAGAEGGADNNAGPVRNIILSEAEKVFTVSLSWLTESLIWVILMVIACILILAGIHALIQRRVNKETEKLRQQCAAASRTSGKSSSGSVSQGEEDSHSMKGRPATLWEEEEEDCG